MSIWSVLLYQTYLAHIDSWLYEKSKAIWRHNTVANENNEKIHCEDVQNDAPKFLKIRIFWRSFWLLTALKYFLRIFPSRYEYVKCCPRSYLSSAFWIMVIQRTNPFLFGKVLTPPPVTLDLGAASLSVIFWKSTKVTLSCREIISTCRMILPMILKDSLGSKKHLFICITCFQNP